MLIWLETKKILLTPMMFVFLALCFGFNLLFVIPNIYDDYGSYVAAASRTTGYKLNAEFEDKIALLEPGEKRDFFSEDTKGRTDVFDGYETAYIAEAYIRRLGLSGYTADAMRDKYAALQNAVDEKADSGESLTLYFAGDTVSKHFLLNGITLRFLFLECGLLVALIVLFSLGYEHANRTAHTVYAAKTGRNIMRHKLTASLSAGLLACTLLSALTLGVYFALNDYGNIWGSSVSSGFNFISDEFAGDRPFVTWQSRTVSAYLLAVLGIALLLAVCFGLMAYVIGTLLKNSYISFLIFLIVNAKLVVFAVLFSKSLPAYLAVHTPVWLWLKQPLWFTDGGPDFLWKNFETLGVLASLILLAGLCLFSTGLFRKRDVA